MKATPFVRNVPTERLYRSAQIDDAGGYDKDVGWSVGESPEVSRPLTET